jgi:hypothetical protein
MCHKGKGTFIDGILEAADNRTLWTCKERGFTYWDFLFSPAWNVSRTEEADPRVLESVTRPHPIVGQRVQVRTTINLPHYATGNMGHQGSEMRWSIYQKSDRSLTPEPSPIQLRDRNRSTGIVASAEKKSRIFSTNFLTVAGELSKKLTVWSCDA